MNKMRLQIICPRKVLFDGECTMLEYNTTEGYVGILPGHVAMTQILAPGKMAIYEENVEKPHYLACMSGIAKILPDLVIIMIEVGEFKEEIDIDRAKAAKERAEKRLNERNDDKLDVERAKYALRKALVRIEVGKIQ